MSRTRNVPHPRTLSPHSTRSVLAVVWLAGSGAIFFVVLLQSLLGHYADLTQQAWNWLLPMLMPTLGLVTGARLAATGPQSSPASVRKIVFRVAIGLSLFYLLAILLTILIQPFASTSPSEAIDLMRRSSIWLGPLQGLTASAVGVLFVSKEKVTDAASDAEHPPHPASKSSGAAAS